MSRRNRFGDDDFEIPDIDIPISPRDLRDGLRNKKTRGSTIVLIFFLAALFIFFAVVNGQNNSNSTSSSDRSSTRERTEYSRPYQSDRQPVQSASYVLVGKVISVDPNLNFIKIRINSLSNLSVGQEVLIANTQPNKYEYSASAVVESVNGNLAGLTPKSSIMNFRTGMNVYRAER